MSAEQELERATSLHGTQLRLPDSAEVGAGFGVGPSVLAKLPFNEFFEAAVALPTRAPYLKLGSAANVLKAVAERYGSTALEGFARLVLVRSIHRTWPNSGYAVPDSIAELQQQHFERVSRSVLEEPVGYYDPYSDNFLKDFGICRMQLLPVGASVLDVDKSLWRRPVRIGPFRQRFGFLGLLCRTPPGRAPYFQSHLHKETLTEFTEDGWHRAYLRIAELLRMHPDVKGFFRSSWFCDPVVSAISPRLAYLVDTPRQFGAYLFYAGLDESGDALTKSPTRRAMYEAGEYVPRRYMLVWHRDDMLDWADREAHRSRR